MRSTALHGTVSHGCWQHKKNIIMQGTKDLANFQSQGGGNHRSPAYSVEVADFSKGNMQERMQAHNCACIYA